MLDKAIAAVKADQVVAIAKFVKGEGGFLDRELIHSVSESRTGRPSPVRSLFQLARTLEPLRIASGNAYGVAIYAARRSRKVKITEVPSYMFPKARAPPRRRFRKVSFVTRVGDLGCGVGDYK
jgi:hypothetical protein